ncbi:Polysulfide reductase NrfD [Geoglobus ahangari]|uniref:Polysulfide reductase NrfD n=1 Tax=Geoglobus ahangari TaxID=113653 RepID=A0A0F7IF89_9EURY|nr:NrfD/PsrC family molybdoenzyme membrane anchor subunit [Geoglobus ahangari]AKG91404.1 Polysulfide reductase NrfD [Geoglobus ahangari]
MSDILEIALRHVQGFIYPNEVEIYWSVLIAVYPYITGLVAGAFIVASLERIFRVEEVKPTYRLALLTALAFLITAPMPLIAHLGHPERALEIMFTPNTSSAMAMFGFVYAWYLLVVLLIEIYFDYRKDIVTWARERRGIRGAIYRILTLGDYDISDSATRRDEKIVNVITVIGLPSAAFLHGYVGFIFGSVKANPWWSSPLMPIIFLFSAMVSGIALVLAIYVISSVIRGVSPDVRCVDKLASYLLYSYILDLGLEFVEFSHVFYTREEGFEAILALINEKLFFSMIVVQVIVGAIVPVAMIAVAKVFRMPDRARVAVYTVSAILTLVGVFAMRWNVVIGGQILSKTFRGFSYYVMPLLGPESASIAAAIMVVPLVILYVLVKILPPWEERAETA